MDLTKVILFEKIFRFVKSSHRPYVVVVAKTSFKFWPNSWMVSIVEIPMSRFSKLCQNQRAVKICILWISCTSFSWFNIKFAQFNQLSILDSNMEQNHKKANVQKIIENNCYMGLTIKKNNADKRILYPVRFRSVY